MRRLLSGVAANLYGQGVTVALQIAAVPGFLHAWGEARYGAWLLIAASTSIFALADLGILIAGGNATTMALAAADPARARRIFVQVLRAVTAVAIGLAASLAALSPLLPIGDAVEPQAVRATAVLLSAVVLAGLPLGAIELGFRADGGYAAGVVRMGTVRLAETGAALSVAALGGGLPGAALAMLAVRLGGIAATGLALRRRAGWLRDPAPVRDWSDLRGLARPALAAAVVPAGLLLAIQGTTVAAGAAVAGPAVAVFVATRTLTRALVQALGLLNHALMPEAAMAAGAGDAPRALALQRLNLVAGAGLLIPGWLALAVFGPALMRLWTGGRISPDPTVVAFLAGAACLHGFWLSASNLLLAVNRGGDYAFQLLLVSALTCLLTLVLGRMSGLTGIAAASLVGEAAMAALILPGQVRAALGPGRFGVAEARP